jgi:hypothetical protein
MINFIEQYLSRPEVFTKIASTYPNAGAGLPTDFPVLPLKEAVANLAARSYLQRKEAALITSGLHSLGEICDEQSS